MGESGMVAVVLAAGKGTRLKSRTAKVLHRAGGRALVEHVVRACQSIGTKNPPSKTEGGAPTKAVGSGDREGVTDVVVIVGHQAEQVREVVEPLGARAVVQEPQNGTGHAMLVARAAIGEAKTAVVLPGDAPLIRKETIEGMLLVHMRGQAAATILSAILHEPAGYGRIVRKADGTVEAIVEDSAATAEQRKINEVNSSIYCFDLEKLWPAIEKVKPENKHKEIYLTDAIALLRKGGEKVLAEVASDANEVLGCNTRAELAMVDAEFRRRKRAALMENGVTIYLPETVVVDAEVEIGADTVIEPFVHLLGATRIGAGCLIQTGSVVVDSEIGDVCVVKPHSVVNKSRLEADVQIGPFAHLREAADLKSGARVGNFVEMKKTVLGAGSKAMHLTYLGDTTIGEKSNIGAGTITCNYDGVNKNKTTIGDRVFVGSNTALVAPVELGDGAYVAAGSTITESVPADALGIARGKQVNKEGRAAELRAKMEAEKAKKKHVARE